MDGGPGVCMMCNVHLQELGKKTCAFSLRFRRANTSHTHTEALDSKEGYIIMEGEKLI